MRRWNQAVKKAKIDFEFKLPHRAFHRAIGSFSEIKASPDGRIVTEADWTHRHGDWLSSDDDRAFVKSLMMCCVEPGKIAGWIAPPTRGVNKEDPAEYEYVRFNK